ncbi:uncharacterized protein DEA37_0007134 [Paragonimus westermani]|uniref:Uridylate-specific endoribonuclease n=1 Tax=Paragonimus westermani TaxID=34504 RepID=A0A5J4NI82_9TREM|nr:uncharacterized protein DEA37_0007134 [Paragonimus westermani]
MKQIEAYKNNNSWSIFTITVYINVLHKPNYAGVLRRTDLTDQAPGPLFAPIDKATLSGKMPTIAAFLHLLDNYEANVGINELVTKEEQTEMDAFLEEVVKTNVMKEAFAFLRSKGLNVSSMADFKTLLYNLWFGLYGRQKQVALPSRCFPVEIPSLPFSPFTLL